MANIRFSSDILKRLGEELNPNADQGIIELVKNSYDANARTCIVKLDSIRTIGGTVEIVDDGDGMSKSEISNGWLVLGSSSKTKSKKTRLGRIPAGSKGLGRLAALRMGCSATLRTRPRKSKNTEFEVSIDWDMYDQAKLVEDVVLNIASKKSTSITKFGSDIILKDLKNTISRQEVKRLARTLILLADPFGDDPSGFTPKLEAPEFVELEALVEKRYFDEADYHLVASLDANGRVSAEVLDFRGSVLYHAGHDEISSAKDKEKYQTSIATFDLWVFVLNNKSFEVKNTTIAEVREWLSEIGGVHLYENGLRVQPYGNAGNDWLDMNLRRAQSPEERPSTNTVIGRVSVVERKGRLSQKTDRSGFIESLEFNELTRFAQDALEWMARRRLDTAERRRARARADTLTASEKNAQKVTDAISSVPKNSRESVKSAFEKYQRIKSKEIKQLKKEVQLYRTLSTAGITAATFAHESSGNPIKVITGSINTIERRAKAINEAAYTAKLANPVGSIKKSIDSLSVLGSATLKLLAQNKRRWGRVDIHGIINQILDTFKPFLDSRNVFVKPNYCSGSPYILGSDAAVESIFTNLLNNSLNAFEANGVQERKIEIETEIVDETIVIHFDDSGPGITDLPLRAIWLPGQTSQVNGTGLGLTIVRDTIVDLGGKVIAEKNGPLKGARMTIELPLAGEK